MLNAQKIKRFTFLQSRGCPLKGLPATPTLEAHQQRFLTNGWEEASALDLDTIYKDHLDPLDKRRYDLIFMHMHKSGYPLHQ